MDLKDKIITQHELSISIYNTIVIYNTDLYVKYITYYMLINNLTPDFLAVATSENNLKHFTIS